MENLILLSLIQLVQADAAALPLAPPSFELDQYKAKAQFVDFGWAQYEINFDIEAKKAIVETHIVFHQSEEGLPLFDLIPEPKEIYLDGELVKSQLIESPDKETKLRAILESAGTGEHRLLIKSEIEKNLKFADDKVSIGFWYSDLDDREFLEQYLPTNLEFDQYSMNFKVHLQETAIDHKVFTNGRLQIFDENSFQVSFPDTYNCSSPFFHMGPASDFVTKSAIYKSIDGRELPVLVYTKERIFLEADIEEYLKTSLKTLAELERDFGPFPHSSLTVYAAPNFGGGMEYAGATITDHWALPHEITHSYFGRGLMPANGNAGWIDEALASWRDENYLRRENPGYSSGRLASFSPYRRTTTGDAYTKGRNFMSYVDFLISEKNPNASLKIFLKDVLSKHTFQIITTGMLKQWVEEFLQVSLQDDFDQYVLGRNKMYAAMPEKSAGRSPYHPKKDEESMEPWL